MNPTNPIYDALRTILRQRSFLVAAGVLLVSAISLNAATEFLELHFKKRPVEVAADLKTIPSELGNWVQVSKDERLNEDLEHGLGTETYLYRDYVDRRQFSEEELKAFEGKTASERKSLLARMQAQKPEAVISVGVTYYTGMVDTVAHVPDRCYIADGYEPKEYKVESWSAFENRRGRDRYGDVRYINFEDQIASRQSVPRNVAYFFHANGEYTADPIGVRLKLQDLFQQHAYYCKIELMTVTSRAEESARAMNDFLASALPEIERCLPDWEKVNQSGEKH